MVAEEETGRGFLLRLAGGLVFRWFGLIVGTLFWSLLPLGWRLAAVVLTGGVLLVGGLLGWWASRRTAGAAWRLATAAVLLALLVTLPTPGALQRVALLLLLAALAVDSAWSARAGVGPDGSGPAQGGSAAGWPGSGSAA